MTVFGGAVFLLGLHALAPTINVPLAPTIAALDGHAFRAEVKHGTALPFYLAAADRQFKRHISRLVLEENGRPLGPSHALEEDVAARGSGAYYHGMDERGAQSIVFSASDNSDPRTNGRVYAAAAPVNLRLRAILGLMGALGATSLALAYLYRDTRVVRGGQRWFTSVIRGGYHWLETHPGSASLIAVVAIVADLVEDGLMRKWPGLTAFGEDFAARIVTQMPLFAAGVALCALYATVCLALGLRLLRALRDVPRLGNCAVASAFLLGLGCLGILWQYLAVFACFKPWLLYTICLLSLFCTWRELGPAAASLVHSTRHGLAELQRLPLTYKFLAAVILLCFLPAFLLLPLQPLHIDALAYYAAQAKLIAHTGTLVPLGGAYGRYQGFLQLGMPMEMNYALLYALGPGGPGAIALRLLVCPALLSLLVLCSGVGRTIGIDSRRSWLVVSLVLTSTTVTAFAYGGKTDLYAAAMGMAAIYWLLDQPDGTSRRHYIIAGVFSGLAALVKFSYLLGFLPLMFVLLAWWLNQAWRQHGACARRHARSFLAALCVTLLIGWTLKNALWAGEPFAPFFIFSDLQPFPLDHAFYSADVETYLRLIFPFALFFGDLSNSQLHLSPLLLGMLPFLCFPLWQAVKRRELTKDVALLVASCTALAAWAALKPQIVLPRHFLASCLALMPPVVHAAQVYFEQYKDRLYENLIVVLALTLLILSAPGFRPLLIYHVLPYLAYADDYAEYRDILPRLRLAPHGELRMAAAINRDARKALKVYVAGYATEPLRGDVLAGMKYLFFDDETTLQRLFAAADAGGAGSPVQSPGDLWRRMAADGVDYVMVSRWTQGEAGKRYFSADAIPPDVHVEATEFSDDAILYKFDELGSSEQRE